MKTGSIVNLFLAFSLLLFAGCLPRYSTTATTPPEPPIEYDAAEVAAFLGKVDDLHPDLGFKGLHLGMTCEEVNALVKDTPWGYLYERPSESGPGSASWYDDPQCRPSNFLKADNSRMGANWASITRTVPEGEERHPLAYVYIKSNDGGLVLINLAGPGYPGDAVATEVKAWGRFALAYLTEAYGDPDHVAVDIDGLDVSVSKEGYEVPLYEWDRGEEKIILYLSESDAFYGCGIILKKR